MNNDNGGAPTIQAVEALRARGVNNPEDMLEHATPADILIACHRWDGQRGVSPGLLVHWIRNGEFDEPPALPPPSKGATMRARFDEYAARFPEGAVAESHRALQARRYPEDEPCPGSLIVIETTYPLITVECDQCDYQAAYPARSLHVLG